jgi:metal-responsive CopG/Arc/MetJ family transcriptional regulator
MTSLEIPGDLKAGLDLVKVRDGVPQSEQIRRAIRAWLEAREAIEPQERLVTATRASKRTTSRRGKR